MNSKPRHHYSLFDNEGFVIDELHELQLAVSPHPGEVLVFAKDGLKHPRMFKVKRVIHNIHLDLDRETFQAIDIIVEPYTGDD